MVGALDHAAELGADGLLSVADAEHRQAQVEHDLRRARRVAAGHRGRTAGEDDALGREVGDALGLHVEGKDLAIDAALAHPPGDELGHLGPKVENEDAVGHAVAPSLCITRYLFICASQDSMRSEEYARSCSSVLAKRSRRSPMRSLLITLYKTR